MTKGQKDEAPPPKRKRQEERRARQAEALRRNLQLRKAATSGKKPPSEPDV